MFKKLITNYFQEQFGSAPVPCTFVLPDGAVINSNINEKSLVKTVFKNYRPIREMALKGDIGFAEGYIKGDIDIEGDPSRLLHLRGEFNASSSMPHWVIYHHVVTKMHELRLGNKNLRQAKKNALFHYNRGSENLFHQYLDSNSPYNVAPTYTCAYWKDGTKNLAEAQFNKLDDVCRKVQLQKGDKLIDVGSGWGSLLFHAWEHYGAEGLNLSPTPDQNRWMQEKIDELGLQEKIKIRQADFREIDGLEGYFDKYISTGVYEHAGKPQLEAWINAMAKVLKPGGLGVLHFIGRQAPEDTGVFIRRHVFPGGYLPELGETLEIMQKYNLEALDIENRRRHYYHTLLSWAKNFDQNWDSIHQSNPEVFNEAFRRTWRFYLYACAGLFDGGDTNIALYQITFSKGFTSSYPMDRRFLYKDEPRKPIPTKLGKPAKK